MTQFNMKKALAHSQMQLILGDYFMELA